MIAALLLTLSARAADCRPDPAALLRSLSEVWPSEARTTVRAPQTLLPGERLELGAHAGRLYVLAAAGEHGLMGEAFVDAYDPTYQLVLHALDARAPDGRPLDSQVLFSQENPQTLPILLWAGELDGDGRPDLLLDLAGEQTTLLLSGAPEDGRMVHAVAAGRASGC